jgi:hypothetical protein
MKPSPERIARVERLKATLREPFSEIERRNYRCQVAAVAAEDDRKRQPAPQLPLEVAA